MVAPKSNSVAVAAAAKARVHGVCAVVRDLDDSKDKSPAEEVRAATGGSHGSLGEVRGYR